VPGPENLEVGRVLVPVRFRHDASLHEMLNIAELHGGLKGTSKCNLAAIIMETGSRTRQDAGVTPALCPADGGRAGGNGGGEQLLLGG
jgi:hypothetical protein